MSREFDKFLRDGWEERNRRLNESQNTKIEAAKRDAKKTAKSLEEEVNSFMAFWRRSLEYAVDRQTKVALVNDLLDQFASDVKEAQRVMALGQSTTEKLDRDYRKRK